MKAYRMIVLGGTLLLSLLVVLAAQASREKPDQPEQPAVGEYAYITHSPPSIASVVDTNTLVVATTIDLSVYGCDAAEQAAMHSDGVRVYVSCYSSNLVLVINTNSNAVEDSIPGVPSPWGIAFTRNGSYALVGGSDVITVIDTATNTIVDTIAVDGTASRLASHPVMDVIYTTLNEDYSGSVLVIDGITFEILDEIPVGYRLNDVDVSPDGLWIYAVEGYYGRLVVIDAATREIYTSVSDMQYASGLAVSPDESEVYVIEEYDTIKVISTSSWTVIETMYEGGGPRDGVTTCDGNKLFVSTLVGDVSVFDLLTYTWVVDIPIEGSGWYGIALCPPYVADGAFLSPRSQNGHTEAGETLNYTLQMINLTGGTDSFDLELLPGNAWGTTLSTDQVGPIPDGEMVSFTASVEVPSGVAPGGSDTVVIQATSVTSPTVYTSTATLHTVATSGELAYVPMGNENGLALIDTVLHTTIDTVDLAQYGCNHPLRARLNPDGTELYVTCDSSDNIIVLDTAGLSLIAVIDRPGTHHQDIAFVQSGQYALASTLYGEGVYDIAVIDTASHTVIQTIPTPGYEVMSIAAHPFLPLAYAASTTQWGTIGGVIVIDTNAFTVQTIIPFGVIVRGVQPSRDGQWVYASDYMGCQGVAKIDVQTNEIIGNIGSQCELFGLQISPDGSRLFVAGGFENTVHVLDAINMTYITGIEVGGRTSELALTCDGSELYVAQEGSTIPVIDTQTYQVTHNITIPGTNTSYGITVCPQYLAEGAYLIPSEQAKDGGRGETVAYQETLFNNFGITETFDLAFSGNTWDTQLSTAQIGPLPSGETASFTVTVAVPVDAPWYDADSVTIQATGVTSPALSAEAQITTTAFAPAQVEVSPTSLGSTQYTNQVTTQPLTISNGNGVTLTYAISEPVPWLSIDPQSGSIPTNGSLTVQVAFDATAMQPGVYETTLLVNSNDPLKPFVEVPVSMTVATVAPFSVEIEGLLDGLVGESYAFTATVSPISTTLPIEYSWQASGQGAVIHTNGLSDTLAYTWDSPGTQLITVTATNFGGSVVATHTLTINDVPISGLLASSDSPTLLGESTTFTATVEAGTNLSYAWDFGDDFSASGVVVTHTYAAAGVYTATVTASNSVGSEQASTLVQVVIPETKVYLPVIPQGDTPGVEEVFWRRQE